MAHGLISTLSKAEGSVGFQPSKRDAQLETDRHSIWKEPQASRLEGHNLVSSLLFGYPHIQGIFLVAYESALRITKLPPYCVCCGDFSAHWPMLF